MALKKCGLLFLAEYKRAKLDEEEAITQARLARILRASDWDSENKKPILWQPPQEK